MLPPIGGLLGVHPRQHKLAWQVGAVGLAIKGLSLRMGQGSPQEGQPGCAATRIASGNRTFSCHFGQMFHDVLVKKKKKNQANVFFLSSFFLEDTMIPPPLKFSDLGLALKGFSQGRDTLRWSHAQLLAPQSRPLARLLVIPEIAHSHRLPLWG